MHMPSRHTNRETRPGIFQATLSILIASAACWSGAAVAADQDLPLLGSSHARSYVASFCANQPDSAIIPEDPRRLIKPGVNAGRAVAFNAYWQDCHAPSNNPWRAPTTCGQWRGNRAEGERLIYGDGYSGGTTVKVGQDKIGILPVELYRQMWTRWGGYLWRPANFDELVRERYGFTKANYHNPYPLLGEDPNRTNGGSGQLPVGLRQTRTKDGLWTGTLSLNCTACHGGDIALPGDNGQARYFSGLGGKRVDLQLFGSDALLPALPIGHNTNAGVSNAFGISAGAFNFLDLDTFHVTASSILKGLTMQLNWTSGGGDTKAPVWWNLNRKPRKFWDGGMSADNVRMLPLGAPVWVVTDPDVAGTMDEEGWPIMAYIDSLESPPYPGPIDATLAEHGAILFHTRDLWADGSNSDKPRPPSNGSCAGCHGAYSPRYVNDPAFLEDPRLEGYSGYIAPLSQIQTDSSRVDAYNQIVLDSMSSSVFSYPEGSPGYVPPSEKTLVQEDLDDWDVFTTGKRVRGACNWQGTNPGEPKGYMAQPLHGIWATGPYLHNASIPTLWDLLKSSDRPTIWRRKLTDGSRRDRGYSVDFATAYDTHKVGWKYDTLNCGSNSGGLPYVSCDPEPTESIADFVKFLNALLPSATFLGYQVTPPLTASAIEARKAHNGYLFGKNTSGHTFAKGLTDDERLAIIEYLKTL